MLRSEARDFAFGMRPADLISGQPSGRLLVDLSHFDEIAPVP